MIEQVVVLKRIFVFCSGAVLLRRHIYICCRADDLTPVQTWTAAHVTHLRVKRLPCACLSAMVRPHTTALPLLGAPATRDVTRPPCAPAAPYAVDYRGHVTTRDMHKFRSKYLHLSASTQASQ